jgi:hypothetical protein
MVSTMRQRRDRLHRHRATAAQAIGAGAARTGLLARDGIIVYVDVGGRDRASLW